MEIREIIRNAKMSELHEIVRKPNLSRVTNFRHNNKVAAEAVPRQPDREPGKKSIGLGLRLVQ